MAIPQLSQAVPSRWQNTLETHTDVLAPDLTSWWMVFKDPLLDTLVTRALNNNLELAQARARIRQARYLAAAARATFRPQLAARSNDVQDPDTSATYFQFGLDAHWELGLFGSRDSAARIAKGHLDSAAADAMGVRVSIVAEVVRTYLDLRAAERRTVLLGELVQVSEHALELLEVRKREYLASADDVDRATAQLAQVKSERAMPQQIATLAAQRLAVLLGQAEPDKEWLEFGAQPQLGRFDLQAVPADLLRTRPDIQSAQAGVLQAGGELGVARAEMYPHIAFGAAYLYSAKVNGFSYGSFNSIRQFGPAIDVPLFDWGQRKATTLAQSANLDRAVLVYRQTVLEAASEVESALAALTQQNERTNQQQIVVTALQRVSETKRKLVGLGLASEWDGLDDERKHVQAELEFTTASSEHAQAFVALYKALGGAPLPLALDDSSQ